MDKPTQGKNILDLFITNTPTLISHTEVMPGISDHDMVYCDTSLKAKISNKPKRKIYLYKLGDRDGLRSEIKTFADEFDKMDHEDVNGMWTALKLHLNNVFDK